MGVSVNNTSCGTGTFSGGDQSASFAVEVDQYVFTPGPMPVKTVRGPVRLHEPGVEISGTIAYHIVPPTPERLLRLRAAG